MDCPACTSNTSEAITEAITEEVSEEAYEEVSEAIAVVGLACRFPGADGPEEFWALLSQGRDAITEPPPGRDMPHKGGFLTEVAGFDAAFFGVTPREATAMDPQQRLALEMSWEAIEHARLAPSSLRRTRTGVFLGAIADDYAALVHARGTAAITGHTTTGLQRGIIANRVSYALGLRGPSLVVDSAQSSALVAVQLACESLRSGGSELALAGGVNLNLLPDGTLALARFGSLSPDSRCHTFDSRANGYARGEGGGIVVLKRLRDAVRDGDTVHCVIRGGAVNSDGSTPTLPTPGRAGQEDVLRSAYAQAGTAPDSVQYVELHGTGTPVGDPVEAGALGAVLGAGRSTEEPLVVGSVKTNIGHLEGAAGIAGFIKTVLCLKERRLVPSLNFATPNPDIPLDRLRLRVGTDSGPWPRPDGPLIAGVSSFGMGGTNCHMVLASWDHQLQHQHQHQHPDPAPDGLAPWVLSARAGTSLRTQAARLLGRLREQPLPAASVGRSLAVSRSVFEHRAVVLADDDAGRLAALDAIAQNLPAHTVVQGQHSADAAGVVFVFPGQGSQWAGMGAELLDSAPEFARSIEECADALRPHVPWELIDVLRGAPSAPTLERDDVIQPVLWAVMVSLAALWRSAGVEPSAVVGHSQGEIAAATAIGALSLQDGARIVALRSRALARIAGRGGLLSVGLPADRVGRDLSAGHPLLCVAAVNGPAQTVVAGPPDALDALVADYGPDVRTRRVPVDYASHSPDVEELRGELLTTLAGVAPRAVGTPFYSTVTGEPLATDALDTEYWYRNLRAPVRFHAAVEAALDAGHQVFVEVSPHPVLTPGIQQTLEDGDATGSALGTLRRDEGGRGPFLRALAEAFAAGVAVDWSAVLPGSAPLVDLPTYAFDRQPYWIGEGPEPTVEAALPQAARESAALTGQDLAAVREVVRAHTAAVAGFAAAGQIDPERSFKDLGLDSALTVQLRNRLADATGLKLTSNLFFDHPSPVALSAAVHARLSGTQAGARTESAAPALSEPIAIVGMGCRFPGDVRTPEDLWHLVDSGTDAIGDFPDDRGWDLAGLLSPEGVRTGGFLGEVAGFDAEFFGISPREATAMDPQQRLVLETAWEALERAGIVPGSLRGTRAGVFVGAMAPDYGPRLHQAPEGVAGFALTGSAASVISGRVAYVLGTNGPAVTVDTACSSSLVALHQAVRALRSGECSIALAGGAAVMSTPGMFVEFGHQGGLAPDGRCKAFSARADGTAWAEGAGMLVLERLSDAQRDGHPILAVVAGSATNSDGASNGLTAPNGTAQQQVIHAALADAGLAPWQVDAVEAHGTGTTLGDPVEAGALLATYGQQRSGERPLWLGSLKSNLGHAQAAAGVGGVIKMVMALRHGRLPRTLHADEPSPHVDWETGAVSLLDRAVEWPRTGAQRRCAVSSFGISGTNAHVVLAQAPAEASATPDDTEHPPVTPLALSAKSADGLRDQARRLAGLLAVPGTRLWPTARSLTLNRSAFEHRAVVVAADGAAALAGLRALAGGETVPHVVSGVTGRLGKTVFVFPGQGSQWAGMATRLAAESPVFARRLAQCAEALAPYTDWSLTEVLDEAAGAPQLDRVDVVQPALWAVMVSLAELWRSLGVRPDAVLGHSQGEIAAACVAGALSLDDAARVVALRSRAIGAIAGHGAMAMLPLSAADTEARVAGRAGRISVASANGPSTTVVSGDQDAVAALVDECRADGVDAKLVPVDYASHSAHVERIEDDVLAALAPVAPGPAAVPLFSSVTGDWHDGAGLDAAYWYGNLRGRVRFEESVRGLAEQGHTTFIEVSAHPVLAHATEETLRECGVDDSFVTGTLRRDDGGLDRFLRSAAAVQVRGGPVAWENLAPEGRSLPAELPTYPFQHTAYWLAPSSGAQDAGQLGQRTAGHPLLGAAVELADGGTVFTGRISARTHPWLADHAVAGSPLLPGTGFLDLALHAGEHTGCGTVEELTIAAPLLLPGTGSADLQIVVSAADSDGRRAVRIHARTSAPALPVGMSTPTPAGDEAWQLHAEGTVAPQSPPPAGHLPPAVWPPVGAVPVPLDELYAELAANGYDYGPAFQGLRAAWWDGDTLCAEAHLPDPAPDAAAGHRLHPALLDACLHPLVGREPEPGKGQLLPFAWHNASLHGVSDAGTLRLQVAPAPTGVADTYALTVLDGTGTLIGAIGSLTLRRSAVGATAAADDSLLRLTWPACPTPEAGARPSATLLDGTVPAAPVGWLAPATTDHPLVALAALRASLDAGQPVPELVVAACGATPADGGAAAAGEAVKGVLALLQAWLADERLTTTRLALVTHGAVSTREGESAAGLAHAAVWGAVRTAQTENPGRFTLLDVDVDAEMPDMGEARVLATLAGDEPQLALRGSRFAVPRLATAEPGATLSAPMDGGAWRLGILERGTFDQLALIPSPEADAPLGPGQVRVAIRAAGLNFRDVLNVLGMYPGDPGPLGLEGAGVVTDTGPGVTGVLVGDHVMGLFSGACGPVAVTDRRMLVRIPDGWTFTEAATAPIAFLTAYHGLYELGGLRAGQTLLVHAATGGVGQAAVQLARHIGARVYATASPAKWPVLRGLGLDAEHIASSREAGFGERFAKALGGRGPKASGVRGMDVVLNSLTGELLDDSLDLLAPGGRFIEMGKADPRDADEIAAAHEGARYLPFDLLELPADRIAELLSRVIELIERGAVRPLPATVLDVRGAKEAFRFIGQAQHVGKVVLTMPSPPAPSGLDPSGTVLITGGTGAIARVTARHLVTEHGARHLLLAGRRGPEAPGAREFAAELTALGADVTLASVDVGDRAAVAALLDGVPDAHPLTAVFHTAGVLADGVIGSLTPDQVDAVMHPKAAGAWHLHELTAGSPLASFVLFSSVMGTIGGAGQGNYAAANTFLDALARHRRDMGLPAQSLAWGLWDDADGMAGSLAGADRGRLARTGLAPFSPRDGMALLDRALADPAALLAPVRLDRAALVRLGVELPVVFRDVLPRSRRPRAGSAGHTRAGGQDVRGDLTGRTAEERERLLTSFVRSHTAAVLGHAAPESIPVGKSFKELGFDSLTSVELRNRLNAATDLRLPSTLLFNNPSPAALVALLARELAPVENISATLPGEAELDRIEAVLAALQDDEARSVLGVRLQALAATAHPGAAAQAAAVRTAPASLAPAAPKGAELVEQVETATVDELFDFIDREFSDS